MLNPQPESTKHGTLIGNWAEQTALDNITNQTNQTNISFHTYQRTMHIAATQPCSATGVSHTQAIYTKPIIDIHSTGNQYYIAPSNWVYDNTERSCSNKKILSNTSVINLKNSYDISTTQYNTTYGDVHSTQQRVPTINKHYYLTDKITQK